MGFNSEFKGLRVGMEGSRKSTAYGRDLSPSTYETVVLPTRPRLVGRNIFVKVLGIINAPLHLLHFVISKKKYSDVTIFVKRVDCL